MSRRKNNEAHKTPTPLAVLRAFLALVLCLGLTPPAAFAAAGHAGSAAGAGAVQVQADDESGDVDGDSGDGGESGATDGGQGGSDPDPGDGGATQPEQPGSGGGDEPGGQTGGESGGGESGGTGDQGQTGGGEQPSNPGGDPSGGGGDQPAQPEEPVAPTLLGFYLFYQNYDNPTRPLAYNPTADPLISDAKGTMELYAQSEFSNGNIGWVDDTGVGVVWSIQATYDETGTPTGSAIAEIDRAYGTVRALGQGNGQIVVRCQAQNYDTYAEMLITIKGNAGVPYLTDLQICDESGAVYEPDAEIRIESADFGLEKKFTLRATYHDPETGAEFVKETAKGDVVEGATWTVSGDSKVSYVNVDTGVFIAQATGSVRLTCSITGAGLLGDTLSDYVFVLCGGDTLDPDRDYSPADELKVVVKYATEDKQGIGGENDYEEARTWYYSPAELEALGVTENLYTLVKSSGSWGTMKARGVYFERLVTDVINSDDFSLDMVKGFYFGATDDYNPGFVGEAWLFETQRYYFPNMSIGTGNLNAVGVAPMIATQTAQEDLVDEPSGALSDQTRFRLCLGAESTTVNNAQQSIYNIYKITIILNGAPPVGWDEPSGGHSTSTNPGKDPEKQPETNPSTPGGGNDPGQGGNGNGAGAPGAGSTDGGNSQGSNESGGWTPAGNGDNTGNQSSGSSEKTPSTTPASGSATQPSKQSSPQSQAASAQQPSADAPEASANAATAATGATAAHADMQAEATDATEQAIQDMVGDEQHRYQVYEMMSAQPALVEALQLENPLAPFVVPGLVLVAVLGGAYNLLWFRRQTSGNSWSPGMRAAAAAVLSVLVR